MEAAHRKRDPLRLLPVGMPFAERGLESGDCVVARNALGGEAARLVSEGRQALACGGDNTGIGGFTVTGHDDGWSQLLETFED